MENETTETVATPEAKPAPVAGAVATETKPAPVVAQPGAETKEAPSGNEKPRAETEFFKREAKREKKAQEENAELRKQLETLKAQFEKKPAESVDAEPVFSLDDPEGSFRRMREQVRAEATQEALDAIERKQRDEKIQAAYAQATNEATSFLLTRSHLKEDPNAKGEVAEILKQKFMAVADVDPQAAVELSYLHFCRTKGVMPDFDGLPKTSNNATGGKSSAGVSPTAPSTGKRVFAKGEVKAYLDAVKPGSAEHKSRLAETEQAYKEGRVQR